MLINHPPIRHLQRHVWSCVVAAFAEASGCVDQRVLLRNAHITDDQAYCLYRIRRYDDTHEASR